MAERRIGGWHVLALALGVVLLIPLWAVLGVYETEAESREGAHHGADTGEAVIREFQEDTEAFASRFEREDGCVAPRAMGPDEGVQAAPHDGDEAAHRESAEGDATVVYLEAFRFGYTPSELCLEVGRTYEFRMMATDVVHGASISLGLGSMMVRLPPGIMVEKRITFREPGEYLLYCSYYCGIGHPLMQGRILVEPARSSGGMADRPAAHDSATAS